MMMISPSFIHAQAVLVLGELCLVVFGSGWGGCVGAYLDFLAVRMFEIVPSEPLKQVIKALPELGFQGQTDHYYKKTSVC